ncbi:MAG: peptidylprolyl isomerase [Robiginitomaculum sp.]|nr:peptidylprolyl isomerase [Robiginitomaculum sp.]
MMTRITLAVLAAGFLFTTACAEEQQPVNSAPKTTTTSAPSYNLPATTNADWREPDLENTLYIKTKYGTFVVEMMPEFAPKHVTQIKKLARQKFYDNITFHRVMKKFMNQTGDPRGDGTGDSSLPDIPGEFTFRRDPAKMLMTKISREMSVNGEVDTGFYKAMPIASKPGAAAFMMKDTSVDAWGLHCKSVTSMARGESENSANSQFFLMRHEYQSLDTKYTIWGTTIWGRDGLTKIKIGTTGETKNFIPDELISMRVAADVPESERIPVQILRTNSDAFKAYVDTLKSKTGKAPNVCDVEVPVRLKK